MTDNLASLSDHKEKRKLEVISEDLNTVLYLLKLIKSGLKDYSCYVPVRNIYITIVENEQILNKHLEKINGKLDKLHENKESSAENNN